MKTVMQICAPFIILLSFFSEINAQTNRFLKAGVEEVKENACAIVGTIPGAVAGAIVGATEGVKATAKTPNPVVVISGAALGAVGGAAVGAFSAGVCKELMATQPECTTITATINGEVVGQRSSCGSGGSGAGGGGGYPVVKASATRIVRH